jgi:hypothetical protein
VSATLIVVTGAEWAGPTYATAPVTMVATANGAMIRETCMSILNPPLSRALERFERYTWFAGRTVIFGNGN